MNRRRFIARSSLMIGAGRLPAADPALRFPSAPRDRLAIASYSLRTLLRSRSSTPKLDIKDFPAFVVDRFHVHNVEILGQHLPSADATYLADYRSRLTAAGVRVVNIPTGVGASLYDPDEAKRATAIANAKKWIDNAVLLGSPSVRIHIQKAGDAHPDVDRAAECLAEVARYGASKNVLVTLENDDPYSEDAFFIVKVLDQVNSPWLRALPDFCNSMLKGDAKFNYDAMEALFRRAYNIAHLKDSEVEGDKVFRIDLARTFEIVKASGYKGYFSVEFEGEGDPVEGTAKLVDAALHYLA